MQIMLRFSRRTGFSDISDNSLILPINVSYGSGYIMINSEVFD